MCAIGAGDGFGRAERIRIRPKQQEANIANPLDRFPRRIYTFLVGICLRKAKKKNRKVKVGVNLSNQTPHHGNGRARLLTPRNGSASSAATIPFPSVTLRCFPETVVDSEKASAS